MQSATSTSLLKDLLLASEEGRLYDVQFLLDRGRCKVNDEDEVCTVKTVLVYKNILCLCVCCMCPCAPMNTFVHVHVSAVIASQRVI